MNVSRLVKDEQSWASLLEYQVSNYDIEDKTNAKWILYSDIFKYNSIDDLMNDGGCFLLYDKTYYDNGSSVDRAHWCLLSKSGNLVSFFDPYGANIDSIPKKRTKKHLTRLMIKSSKYEYDENEWQFQSYDKVCGVIPQTCGRWCLSRYFNRDISIDDFASLYKPIKPYVSDQLVCSLH